MASAARWRAWGPRRTMFFTPVRRQISLPEEELSSSRVKVVAGGRASFRRVRADFGLAWRPKIAVTLRVTATGRLINGPGLVTRSVTATLATCSRCLFLAPIVDRHH